MNEAYAVTNVRKTASTTNVIHFHFRCNSCDAVRSQRYLFIIQSTLQQISQSLYKFNTHEINRSQFGSNMVRWYFRSIPIQFNPFYYIIFYVQCTNDRILVCAREVIEHFIHFYCLDFLFVIDKRVSGISNLLCAHTYSLSFPHVQIQFQLPNVIFSIYK